MSNYAASTLGQPDTSEIMISACRQIQEVAESVPTYVIYGGPGEMWRHVVNSGGQNCFNTKTAHIRELLASSGHVKVTSGADDFRAFFAISDLDDIGHIRGLARDKAIQCRLDADHRGTAVSAREYERTNMATICFVGPLSPLNMLNSL